MFSLKYREKHLATRVKELYAIRFGWISFLTRFCEGPGELPLLGVIRLIGLGVLRTYVSFAPGIRTSLPVAVRYVGDRLLCKRQADVGQLLGSEASPVCVC